ncbi:MAG: serine acetyltransferase [Dysgonamonadaceae bacterium]|nr:serine acetyltransferase [Dysgonamonadaceae bacterium]
MRNIAIYGFGGFGREIASIIQSINQIKSTWNIAGYFDDGVDQGTSNKYGKVLGGMEELNNWSKPLNVVMAIASPMLLQKISSAIVNPNISFPNIIAPTVLLFDRKTFLSGHGNVLCHNCRISCDVQLGDFNLLNGGVSLGHDVKIGSFNMLQPETRISGETTIGDANFFGVRSLVLQGLKIGDKTRIGTGSVVMRKTKDGMTYFGCPAKILAHK